MISIRWGSKRWGYMGKQCLKWDCQHGHYALTESQVMRWKSWGIAFGQTFIGIIVRQRDKPTA